MIRLDDAVTTARLAAGLPGFLRHPITVADARIVLDRRLERRALDFLALVRRGIYEQSRVPIGLSCGGQGVSTGTSSVSCGKTA